ncbi:MAG: hypothetical protein QM724_11610 [Flavobacteriales bacterium]
MRRLLFLLTLALYGFSALEIHEWVKVPEVLVHLAVHHSDLGHHDGPKDHHEHEGDGDHNPFNDGCPETFCACHAPALIATRPAVLLTLVAPATTLASDDPEVRVVSFSGSKWNPPRLA